MSSQWPLRKSGPTTKRVLRAAIAKSAATGANNATIEVATETGSATEIGIVTATVAITIVHGGNAVEATAVDVAAVVAVAVATEEVAAEAVAAAAVVVATVAVAEATAAATEAATEIAIAINKWR